MGISYPDSSQKECFDVLKKIGFGDLVRLFSSTRQSHRVYVDWFTLHLIGRLFNGSGPIGSPS